MVYAVNILFLILLLLLLLVVEYGANSAIDADFVTDAPNVADQ